MLDPPDGDGAPMPVLEGLLREWSVEAGNNVVIDASGVGQIFVRGPEGLRIEVQYHR